MKLTVFTVHTSYAPLGSNHWVGSTAVGSVVDKNTKVFGTGNLVRHGTSSRFPALYSNRYLFLDFLLVYCRRGYHTAVARWQSARRSHVNG